MYIWERPSIGNWSTSSFVSRVWLMVLWLGYVPTYKRSVGPRFHGPSFVSFLIIHVSGLRPGQHVRSVRLDKEVLRGDGRRFVCSSDCLSLTPSFKSICASISWRIDWLALCFLYSIRLNPSFVGGRDEPWRICNPRTIRTTTAHLCGRPLESTCPKSAPAGAVGLAAPTAKTGYAPRLGLSLLSWLAFLP